MQPVIDHLPLTIHQEEEVTQRREGAELVDTVSGVEQLNQRRAWHERVDVNVPDWLVLFTMGALCATILFLFLK